MKIIVKRSQKNHKIYVNISGPTTKKQEFELLGANIVEKNIHSTCSDNYGVFVGDYRHVFYFEQLSGSASEIMSKIGKRILEIRTWVESLPKDYEETITKEF